MTIFESLKAIYQKNEKVADVSIFIGGFVFDIFSFANPDDWFSIMQQCVYLILIAGLLFCEKLSELGKLSPPVWLSKVWEFRTFILHFVLGSLLSVYSLFYIKSSSFFSSFIFLGIMIALLVGNETQYIQKRGVGFKFSLFVLCVFSFFSIIVPTALGFIGWVPLIISFLLTAAVLYLYSQLLLKFESDQKVMIEKVFKPSAIVMSAVLFFSVFGLIPPVPLSLKYSGVFHGVERVEGGYSLKFEKPWWKFWREGDQDFVSEPGDSVFVFMEVFAPSRFSDTLFLRWELYSSKSGWQTTDRIPLMVKGGRLTGFRGFAEKKNYDQGEWRVKLETSDEREIGRINFNVTKAKKISPDRTFQVVTR